MQTLTAKIDQIESFQKWLEEIRNRVNHVLLLNLKKHTSTSPVLNSAMEYGLLNGGKRIRAAMIYCLADEFNICLKTLDSIAAAVEMVHASSLIHDDLPALDNDDLRRGKPACHIAFNEAIAILAGDALLNLSQEIILNVETISDSQKIQLCKSLASAVGTQGMIGGQALEFQKNFTSFNFKDLKQLYLLKTGCLLGVGLKMAILLTDLPKEKKDLFTEFSNNLGLAFQIYDDILDIDKNSEILRKHKNSDKNFENLTLVNCIGLKKAKVLLEELQKKAKDALNASGYSLHKLHLIADYIIKRNY